MCHGKQIDTALYTVQGLETPDAGPRINSGMDGILKEMRGPSPGDPQHA